MNFLDFSLGITIFPFDAVDSLYSCLILVGSWPILVSPLSTGHPIFTSVIYVRLHLRIRTCVNQLGGSLP